MLPFLRQKRRDQVPSWAPKLKYFKTSRPEFGVIDDHQSGSVHTPKTSYGCRPTSKFL